MDNYLLVHGSFGNPFVNWFPYLRNEIEKLSSVLQILLNNYLSLIFKLSI